MLRGSVAMLRVRHLGRKLGWPVLRAETLGLRLRFERRRALRLVVVDARGCGPQSRSGWVPGIRRSRILNRHRQLDLAVAAANDEAYPARPGLATESLLGLVEH